MSDLYIMVHTSMSMQQPILVGKERLGLSLWIGTTNTIWPNEHIMNMDIAYVNFRA